MPALEKLRGRVPESLVEIVRLPGLGAKTARRLWQELGITTLAAARGRRARGPPAGPGGLRRAQGAAAARAARGGRRAAQARVPARPGARARAHGAGAAARASRLRAGRRGGLAAPARRDGGRRRRDRRRDRRAGADRVAGRAAVRRRGARPRHDEGLGADPQRRPARPARRAARELRQPAAALHGLEGPQRAHARGRAAARHEHLGVGHRGRRERRGLPHRRRGRGLPPPRLPADPARAARGQRRARAGAPQRAARARRARRTCAATCTCTATGAATASTRCSTWSRPCARAGTSTWRSPTTPAGVGMGIGLEADDVRRQIEAVQRIRETLDGFELLAGCEVDIMGDGSLYLPDDLLAELDWVRRLAARRAAAGFRPHHEAAAGRGRASVRRRDRASVRPHDRQARRATPSTSRPSSAACAAHGTFLEINSQPHRLDLRPAHARLALAAGVKLVISTDAHRLAALDYQELGVFMARRAGATARRHRQRAAAGRASRRCASPGRVGQT